MDLAFFTGSAFSSFTSTFSGLGCAFATGFAFSTLNRAGALVDVMSIFKKYNINLSYIDSRPSKKVFGTYTFYIECDAYIEDDMLQQSIKEIMPLTTFLKFVGSYPKDIL